MTGFEPVTKLPEDNLFPCTTYEKYYVLAPGLDLSTLTPEPES